MRTYKYKTKIDSFINVDYNYWSLMIKNNT